MRAAIQTVCVALVVSIFVLPAPADVKVAVVKSCYGNDALFAELNNNWSTYGTTLLTIDTSLKHRLTNFTYQDLVDTQADVLWFSDSAGEGGVFSASEIAAVTQYVSEGHSLLGTFLLFQYHGTGNEGLAPLFGLPANLTFSSESWSANANFEILVPGPLFRNIGGLGD